MVYPWEIPIAYPDIRSGGYLHEPSIRNYEVWLDWWAHQLDTPHWWAELTTILMWRTQKRLAWKIHASFLILVVRCEALPGQDYNMPLPPNVLPEIGFFLTIHLIKMSDGSPCCWPQLMPRCCGIGLRKLGHQPSQIIALWQWVLWSWCSMLVWPHIYIVIADIAYVMWNYIIMTIHISIWYNISLIHETIMIKYHYATIIMFLIGYHIILYFTSWVLLWNNIIGFLLT